jgi:hypothetical protein
MIPGEPKICALETVSGITDWSSDGVTSPKLPLVLLTLLIFLFILIGLPGGSENELENDKDCLLCVEIFKSHFVIVLSVVDIQIFERSGVIEA